MRSPTNSSAGTPFEQKAIDQLLLVLDGTPNKSALGANAILAPPGSSQSRSSSLGAALYRYLGAFRARAPVPRWNILNGGAKHGWQAPTSGIQIMPLGAETFADGLRWGAKFTSP
jgi:enolase